MPRLETHKQVRIWIHYEPKMTAKAGIKKHGKAAEAALMAEFAQLERT
jgi:hypothetical protein